MHLLNNISIALVLLLLSPVLFAISTEEDTQVLGLNRHSLAHPEHTNDNARVETKLPFSLLAHRQRTRNRLRRDTMPVGEAIDSLSSLPSASTDIRRALPPLSKDEESADSATLVIVRDDDPGLPDTLPSGEIINIANDTEIVSKRESATKQVLDAPPAPLAKAVGVNFDNVQPLDVFDPGNARAARMGVVSNAPTPLPPAAVDQIKPIVPLVSAHSLTSPPVSARDIGTHAPQRTAFTSATCKAENQRCCDQALSQKDIFGRALFDLIGPAINEFSGNFVGLQCLPIVRDILGRVSCSTSMTPVCCEGTQHYDGLINLECTHLLI